MISINYIYALQPSIDVSSLLFLVNLITLQWKNPGDTIYGLIFFAFYLGNFRRQQPNGKKNG